MIWTISAAARGEARGAHANGGEFGGAAHQEQHQQNLAPQLVDEDGSVYEL